MAETTGASNSVNRPAKAFSCVRCFERKVKCDREHPCAGCVRSNVECTFRVPAPPRRKKKRTQEDILTERINQYEQILQQKGIDIQNVPTDDEKPKADGSTERNSSIALSDATQPTSPNSDTDPRSFVAPTLVWEEGRSRYTENNLWTRVAEEFRQSQDGIHESSDEEDEEHEAHEADDNVDFTLGITPSSNSARNLHPTPEQISMLWQIFIDNVYPFTMIVHRPTLHLSIEQAILHLDHVPRGFEALMFAIYSMAVLSMQDREVENTLGESRRTLLSRYQAATKAALARARFMGSSDVFVLQAFVLHLLSMRNVYDGRTLWTLSGVALRIAEGMGLHRDGTTLGLPPFTTEIRRRVWYQIITLDWRSAELSGSRKFTQAGFEHISVQSPLNVNDEDLWPSMTEFPVPRQKITDMVLCCLRYEFSSFWGKKLTQRSGNGDGTIWGNYSSTKSIEEQDAAVDELERCVEEKYVRYCDPSIPVQLMVSIVARTATHSMRLMAHHPRRWASDEEIPESEKNLLWTLSIRLLEAYVMCITSKPLQRFIWHTSYYFQWQALIYLLDCIRATPTMSGADDAWHRIDALFECQPDFIMDTKKAIHVAIGSLCLKAYTAREQAFKKEGRFLPNRPPDYIQILRKQRDAAQAKDAERKARTEAQSQAQIDPTSSISNDLVNMMGFEASSQGQTSQQPLQLQLQQQPLPPFQPDKDHTHRQTGQQAAPFWFDNFNVTGSQFTGADMDWMMVQDTLPDEGSQMNWSQWDYLLQDGGGMTGFGDDRTSM